MNTSNTEKMVAMNQKPVLFFPLYAAIMGSTTGGIVLSQLFFLAAIYNFKEFWHTDQQLRIETWVTDEELKRVKKKLKTLPFLTVFLRGIPPKTRYFIDGEEWDSFLATFVKNPIWSERIQFGGFNQINLVETPKTYKRVNLRDGLKTPMPADAGRGAECNSNGNGIPTVNGNATSSKKEQRIYFAMYEEKYGRKYRYTPPDGPHLKRVHAQLHGDIPLFKRCLRAYFADTDKYHIGHPIKNFAMNVPHWEALALGQNGNGQSHPEPAAPSIRRFEVPPDFVPTEEE